MTVYLIAHIKKQHEIYPPNTSVFSFECAVTRLPVRDYAGPLLERVWRCLRRVPFATSQRFLMAGERLWARHLGLLESSSAVPKFQPRRSDCFSLGSHHVITVGRGIPYQRRHGSSLGASLLIKADQSRRLAVRRPTRYR